MQQTQRPDGSTVLYRWGGNNEVQAVTVNPSNIHQPIRFQGQQLDQETGLHYNRFRYYDPSTGNYVTQDPIGLNGGINNGVYPANPSNFIDPMGLDPTASPPKGIDPGKAKNVYERAKSVFDVKENVQKGRDARKTRDTLICKAEKEFDDKVKNEEMTPQAAKQALAVKKFSIESAHSATTAIDAGSNGVGIDSGAIAYGFLTPETSDCAKLLSPSSTQPKIDFFKK